MTIVCLLQPLIISTLSLRFIPGGTLRSDLCRAFDEECEMTGRSVDVLGELLVAASFVLLFRSLGGMGLLWTCGEVS